MEIPAREKQSPLVGPGQIDHHVADLTATVSADVSLGTLQSTLARQNQWLAIDGNPDHTIGRLVDTNSTGPLRLGFGGWRDILLGCQFQTGRGDLITAGGRTMKNVAGYDLTKLMVGQSGIFGNLVTLTLRTYRKPTTAAVAQFTPDLPMLSALLTSPSRPQWAVITTDALYCGYLADDLAIRFYLKDVATHEPLEISQRSVEEDAIWRQRIWNFPTAPVTFRASVPSARVLELAKAIKPPQWAADPTFGIMVGACPSVAQGRAWQSLATPLAGRILLRDSQSGTLLYYATSPAEQRIIETLKRSFDPKAALTALPNVRT